MKPPSEPAPRPQCKWWGWGDAAVTEHLVPEAEAILRERLGELAGGPRPPALAEFQLPAPGELPAALHSALGQSVLLTDTEQRLRHACGRGYADLISLRRGALPLAPDAVIVPPDSAALGRLIEACARSGVAIVPYGGGTSVVGGLQPLGGTHHRVISLDLSQLRGVAVDPRTLSARLGAGLRGCEAEAALRERGLTLGHFPQSFEYATIGGFAATRSVGQASSGYGRFDQMVSAISLLAPAGELRTPEAARSAAGPSLRELVLGSEGTLGVISEVTVRVRRAPAQRRYEGWIAESFEAGAEIVRAMAQGEGLPEVIRLSDEEETQGSLQFSGAGGLGRALLERYLALRRRRRGCLLIAGWEGSGESVARRRALAARALRSGGAVYLGRAPGRAWERGRYQAPYLRDTLIDLGVMVETVESSHTWSRLGELYRSLRAAIGEALAAQGTPGLVFCHLSHAYADGASLYFTVLARAQPGREIEQWQAVKSAASAAILATEATITHHHGVGREHAPYMQAELGETGVEALLALKRQLDPSAVMNPGKLLAAASV